MIKCDDTSDLDDIDEKLDRMMRSPDYAGPRAYVASIALSMFRAARILPIADVRDIAEEYDWTPDWRAENEPA